MWAERMMYGTGGCYHISNEFGLFTNVFVVGGSGSGSVIFSGRREGLALYFSRLVRPLWKSQLTKPGCVTAHYKFSSHS
jgi:hypothetical protein